jgi:hypothetical protein
MYIKDKTRRSSVKPGIINFEKVISVYRLYKESCGQAFQMIGLMSFPCVTDVPVSSKINGPSQICVYLRISCEVYLFIYLFIVNFGTLSVNQTS